MNSVIFGHLVSGMIGYGILISEKAVLVFDQKSTEYILLVRVVVAKANIIMSMRYFQCICVCKCVAVDF